MPTITLKDGVEIYYKDWGNPQGQPVTFSHGWPLNADNWDAQLFFLGSQGYRVIAHDRRGHGRSSQPWDGNNLTTYADDLHQLIEHLDLQNITMVGHSTGGGEVARYVGKYGTARVKKAVLIGAITPLMLQTDANPEGLPRSVFDGFREAMVKDRAQFFYDVPSGPFFGFNRPSATRSEGLVQSWWQQGMQAGFKNTYDCIEAFSETDLTEDLKKMDIPVLLLHGDDDQVVPFKAAAAKAIKVLPKGTLKVYPGGAHALPNVNADEVNKDILEFLKK
ncbi:putative hydrolases or acyltransferase [Thelonectria olida]|uniref:Hydrolases or acyltransferase n=1 Tax=Thelonectria olida TaxID=1576542 RepID=A0A9P8VXT4_9HYPO|nr:putative hydrolases or acyltransferase [Thelonectria olida]